MRIVKPIISLLLLIHYIIILGTFTISAEFQDGTEIYYKGWFL
jgi:hypothetical protein